MAAAGNACERSECGEIDRTGNEKGGQRDSSQAESSFLIQATQLKTSLMTLLTLRVQKAEQTAILNAPNSTSDILRSLRKLPSYISLWQHLRLWLSRRLHLKHFYLRLLVVR